MKKKAFNDREASQLAALEALPDEAIDTMDIPEAPPGNWAFARRGKFYRPLKKPVTIRLDADILEWFKAHAKGRGYQTEINRALRRHVLETEKIRSHE